MTDLPIERLLGTVEWHPIPGAGGDELHATHEGVLDFGPFSLKCYTLSDESRVFDGEDLARVFGEQR